MNNLENVLEEMDFQYFGSGKYKIDVESFFSKENALLLDVRTPEEIACVKFPLAHYCEVLEIPTNEIPSRLNDIPKDKTVGVFCSAGVRAAIVFTYLKAYGYDNVKILPGGYPPLMEALKPGKMYKKINK